MVAALTPLARSATAAAPWTGLDMCGTAGRARRCRRSSMPPSGCGAALMVQNTSTDARVAMKPAARDRFDQAVGAAPRGAALSRVQGALDGELDLAARPRFLESAGGSAGAVGGSSEAVSGRKSNKPRSCGRTTYSSSNLNMMRPNSLSRLASKCSSANAPAITLRLVSALRSACLLRASSARNWASS